MKWIPAGLLAAVAKGQGLQLPTGAGGCGLIYITTGDYKTVKCPEPPIVPVERLDWPDGKPLNNQCPVCGTMAASHKRGEIPTVEIAGVLYVEDAMLPRVARCLRCNCAFWQDAE